MRSSTQAVSLHRSVFNSLHKLTLVALVYDIQTSYKGAVYSVKLKLEFTILNQLMNLVKGRLADTTTPNTGSKSYHGAKPTNRSSHLRPGLRDKEHGLPAGAYSKMEDSVTVSRTPASDIKLQDLKSDGVLRTTTTEVRFEAAEDTHSEDSIVRAKGSRRSDSSEDYIIGR